MHGEIVEAARLWPKKQSCFSVVLVLLGSGAGVPRCEYRYRIVWTSRWCTRNTEFQVITKALYPAWKL